MTNKRNVPEHGHRADLLVEGGPCSRMCRHSSQHPALSAEMAYDEGLE